MKISINPGVNFQIVLRTPSGPNFKSVRLFLVACFRREGLMNSVSSDILSARDAKFSDLVHYFFLIFSVKLGEHKRRKVIEPNFSGKFLFGQKNGQKGPKKNKNMLFGCVVKFSWN